MISYSTLWLNYIIGLKNLLTITRAPTEESKKLKNMLTKEKAKSNNGIEKVDDKGKVVAFAKNNMFTVCFICKGSHRTKDFPQKKVFPLNSHTKQRLGARRDLIHSRGLTPYKFSLQVKAGFVLYLYNRQWQKNWLHATYWCNTSDFVVEMASIWWTTFYQSCPCDFKCNKRVGTSTDSGEKLVEYM